jgi:hypothetical protein
VEKLFCFKIIFPHPQYSIKMKISPEFKQILENKLVDIYIAEKPSVSGLGCRPIYISKSGMQQPYISQFGVQTSQSYCEKIDTTHFDLVRKTDTDFQNVK